MNSYARTVPLLSWEFGSVLYLMQVEVIEHTIEIGAGCSIELGTLEGIVGQMTSDVHEDGLLGGKVLPFGLIEGIVVVAVAVYVIGVNLVKVLL